MTGDWVYPRVENEGRQNMSPDWKYNNGYPKEPSLSTSMAREKFSISDKRNDILYCYLGEGSYSCSVATRQERGN